MNHKYTRIYLLNPNIPFFAGTSLPSGEKKLLFPPLRNGLVQNLIGRESSEASSQSSPVKGVDNNDKAESKIPLRKKDMKKRQETQQQQHQHIEDKSTLIKPSLEDLGDNTNFKDAQNQLSKESSGLKTFL